MYQNEEILSLEIYQMRKKSVFQNIHITNDVVFEL